MQISRKQSDRSLDDSLLWKHPDKYFLPMPNCALSIQLKKLKLHKFSLEYRVSAPTSFEREDQQ